MKELNRLLRHMFAPLVAWAVASGYLEYMQGDITETLVLVAAFGIPWGLSKLRDRDRAWSGSDRGGRGGRNVAADRRAPGCGFGN